MKLKFHEEEEEKLKRKSMPNVKYHKLFLATSLVEKRNLRKDKYMEIW